MNPAARIPVIIGVGEADDRPATLADAKEPATLMCEAIRASERDAGADLMQHCDALFIVNEISWPYVDPVKQVSTAMGIAPRIATYGPVGGQTPVAFINEAAQKIAKGEIKLAVVCGAESEHSVQRARKDNVALHWGAKIENFNPVRGGDFQVPLARALEVATPAHVYPFYENAITRARGQTPREAMQDSANLWALYSSVTATRKKAWLKHRFDAAEIREPSPANRPIAWPYTKLQVANPQVNLGAAAIVTSLELARSLNIPENRLIYVEGGAAAVASRDYLQRDSYSESPAMRAVLQKASRIAGKSFDYAELYSCFPCVPKMAIDILGDRIPSVPTVTGGLTFFGAPLNDFMLHACAAMVDNLRLKEDSTGLLYGQGEYVTKHHALVLTRRKPETFDTEVSVQGAADQATKAVPLFDPSFVGPATLETFTVLFNRDATPRHGVAICRFNGGNGRAMAKVPAEDTVTIGRLLDLDRSPVGEMGTITAGDHSPTWSFDSRKGS